MKLWRPLGIVLLLLGGVYLSKSLFFKRPYADRVVSEKEKALPGERVKSFSLFGFSESGQKKWRVEGKTANILSGVIHLTDINADTYGEGTTVNLKADRGIFNRKSQNVELIKNVVVLTSDNTRLKTERLFWHAEEELISTDEHVYIKREDMDIDSVGASAKPNLKTARFNENVRLNIYDPKSLITCDGPLDVDYAKNIAYFNNNVVMDDGKVRLLSDKAIAYIDPDERKLRKFYAEGNVEITRGENTTHAKDLTYLPGEGRLVLGGRPKIVVRNTEELSEK